MFCCICICIYILYIKFEICWFCRRIFFNLINRIKCLMGNNSKEVKWIQIFISKTYEYQWNLCIYNRSYHKLYRLESNDRCQKSIFEPYGFVYIFILLNFIVKVYQLIQLDFDIINFKYLLVTKQSKIK